MEEKSMRGLGYAKTPDVLLKHPIGRLHNLAVSGYIVNWIESKASFGDDFLHSKNLENQYWGYHNRYGPGMVIYWFGYIEDLNKNQKAGILIECDLPENIIEIESPFLTK